MTRFYSRFLMFLFFLSLLVLSVTVQGMCVHVLYLTTNNLVS